MPAKLLTAGVTLIGASEAVTIELLRLAGVAIGAGAAALSAWLTHRGNRELRAARRELRARRREVRDPEHEQALVIDAADERAVGEGARQRRADPPLEDWQR